MERLRVDHTGLGNQADGPGQRRGECRALDGIDPPCNSSTPSVGGAGVAERRQVEAGDVRRLDDFTDAVSGQELLRLVGSKTPRSRVRAVAVELDSEHGRAMTGWRCGRHGSPISRAVHGRYDIHLPLLRPGLFLEYPAT